jgi:hypothetical protein
MRAPLAFAAAWNHYDLVRRVWMLKKKKKKKECCVELHWVCGVALRVPMRAASSIDEVCERAHERDAICDEIIDSFQCSKQETHTDDICDELNE